MRKKVQYLFAILGVIGGLIWIIFGSILASTPPGVPGVSYRNASEFNPISALGMLCLGVSMLGVFLFMNRKGKGMKIGFSLFLTGSILFFIGGMTRITLNGGFEPTKPIGFILCIFGLFIFSITAFIKKNLSNFQSIVFFISGCSLFLFNDQYITAWFSVPFGLAWIILNLTIIFRSVHTNSDQNGVINKKSI